MSKKDLIVSIFENKDKIIFEIPDNLSHFVIKVLDYDAYNIAKKQKYTLDNSSMPFITRYFNKGKNEVTDENTLIFVKRSNYIYIDVLSESKLPSKTKIVFKTYLSQKIQKDKNGFFTSDDFVIFCGKDSNKG